MPTPTGSPTRAHHEHPHAVAHDAVFTIRTYGNRPRLVRTFSSPKLPTRRSASCDTGHRPPTWPPSSARSSSPQDFRHLAPASQPLKKSTSSAWPGKTSRHNRESRDQESPRAIRVAAYRVAAAFYGAITPWLARFVLGNCEVVVQEGDTTRSWRPSSSSCARRRMPSRRGTAFSATRRDGRLPVTVHNWMGCIPPSSRSRARHRGLHGLVSPTPAAPIRAYAVADLGAARLPVGLEQADRPHQLT